MKRIVWHWTGGTGRASDYEKTRYHFLIENDGKVIEGDKPPEANRAPLGSDYVRHAGGFNSDAIGVGLCGMKGASERPFTAGGFPISKQQIQAMVKLTADLCETYDIPVGRKTVLLHSEVKPRFGRGVYKWDINWLPDMAGPALTEEEIFAVGDRLRKMVNQELANRNAQVAPWWRRWWQRLWRGAT